MTTLTYLARAEIRDAQDELNGKVLTRPALLVSDGRAETYACDIDIGKDDPLRNVPIAAGNRELIYANTGAAVRLRRSDGGRYQVVGFSKELPGKRVRVAVNMVDGTFGAAQSVGWSSRPATYGELATLRGYGNTPYGAVLLFRGATMVEIR